MKKSLKLFFVFLLCFCLSSCTNDKKVGLYVFLVDDYSGVSIECIAYKDNKGNIYKLLTKYGTVNVEIVYDEETESYEQLCTYNIDHTLESDFTLNVSRNAYQSDVKRINDYKDLQEPFYFSNKDSWPVLHLSNRNCKKYGNKTVYVPNYSVATLFMADMCENCFPEMY